MVPSSRNDAPLTHVTPCLSPAEIKLDTLWVSRSCCVIPRWYVYMSLMSTSHTQTHSDSAIPDALLRPTVTVTEAAHLLGI